MLMRLLIIHHNINPRSRVFMVKQALILVQGVNNRDGYLLETIDSLPDFKSRFSRIINVPINSIFVKKKNWFLKMLGKMGDSLDDVFSYYLHSDERVEACRAVREAIKGCELDGLSIVVIAHSLGTVITLTSGPNKSINPVMIDSFYMLGSPLGFKYFMLRGKTNAHSERYSNNFIARKIHYLYSKKDTISCKLVQRTIDTIQARSIEDVSIYETETSHSDKEYMTYLIKNIVLD